MPTAILFNCKIILSILAGVVKEGNWTPVHGVMRVVLGSKRLLRLCKQWPMAPKQNSVNSGFYIFLKEKQTKNKKHGTEPYVTVKA